MYTDTRSLVVKENGNCKEQTVPDDTLKHAAQLLLTIRSHSRVDVQYLTLI
jgi:hypothetical protein